MRSLNAARAYADASRQRSLREQEADVFHRVNVGLRQADGQGDLATRRAVSDNMRLWIAVVDNLRDPGNGLPEALRASIISVGLAVQREGERPEPDLSFMIGVNEQMVAGLYGK